MTDPLLGRILVPVANEEDTKATCDALVPHLDERVEFVNVLYVVEQTEGYIDTTSPEALTEEANRWFDIAEEKLEAVDEVRTEIRYGTDVVDEIVASATEHDATAIVFRPREKGRLTSLFSSSIEHRLLTESPCPVIALDEDDETGLTEVSN